METIIVATLFGKIAIVGGAGFAIATALEWFHEMEVKPRTKKKEGRIRDERLDDLSKKLESRS